MAVFAKPRPRRRSRGVASLGLGRDKAGHCASSRADLAFDGRVRAGMNVPAQMRSVLESDAKGVAGKAVLLGAAALRVSEAFEASGISTVFSKVPRLRFWRTATLA